MTEKESGTSIDLHSGDTLAISLPDNPTTGFRWETESVNEHILHPVEEPVYEPSSNLVGSGGRTTFQFTAANAGNTPLRLVYRRSFEKDAPPASTFELNATVIGQ